MNLLQTAQIAVFQTFLHQRNKYLCNSRCLLDEAFTAINVLLYTTIAEQKTTVKTLPMSVIWFLYARPSL